MDRLRHESGRCRGTEGEGALVVAQMADEGRMKREKERPGREAMGVVRFICELCHRHGEKSRTF